MRVRSIFNFLGEIGCLSLGFIPIPAFSREPIPLFLSYEIFFVMFSDNDCSVCSFTACSCDDTFLVFFKCWCKFRASRSHHRPLLPVQYTSWDRRVRSSCTASCSNRIVSLITELKNKLKFHYITSLPLVLLNTGYSKTLHNSKPVITPAPNALRCVGISWKLLKYFYVNSKVSCQKYNIFALSECYLLPLCKGKVFFRTTWFALTYKSEDFGDISS